MVEEKIEFQFHCGNVELCMFPDQFCSSTSYTCLPCSDSVCAQQNIPLQCLYHCGKRIREEDSGHIQAWHVALYCVVTAIVVILITVLVCVFRRMRTCRRTEDDTQADDGNILQGNQEREEYCRPRLAGIQPVND